MVHPDTTTLPAVGRPSSSSSSCGGGGVLPFSVFFSIYFSPRLPSRRVLVPRILQTVGVRGVSNGTGHSIEGAGHNTLPEYDDVE